MVIADFEGDVKLQINLNTFTVDKVFDKDVTKRYRVWLKNGFPEPDEGPEPKNDGDSTFILKTVKINKKSLNRFNNFLMGESLRIII